MRVLSIGSLNRSVIEHLEVHRFPQPMVRGIHVVAQLCHHAIVDHDVTEQESLEDRTAEEKEEPNPEGGLQGPSSWTPNWPALPAFLLCRR